MIPVRMSIPELWAAITVCIMRGEKEPAHTGLSLPTLAGVKGRGPFIAGLIRCGR